MFSRIKILTSITLALGLTLAAVPAQASPAPHALEVHRSTAPPVAAQLLLQPREATGQYVYTCIPNSGVSYITTKANLKKCNNYIDVTINGKRILHIKAKDTYIPGLECYWDVARTWFEIVNVETVVGFVLAVGSLATVGSSCSRS